MTDQATDTVTEGGTLDFNCYGIAGCARCGWSGVPTLEDGKASTYCPACEPERGYADVIEVQEIEQRRSEKVARNAPCPCGSGVKAKKCCHA